MQRVVRVVVFSRKSTLDQQDHHNDCTACPFCHIGQDSRHHWRFECPSTEAIMTQINITRGGILATSGFSLWFDTNLRTNIIHLDNSPIHITQEAILTDLTPTSQITSDNREHRSFVHRRDILQAHSNHSSWFPTDRIALLVTLWKSPRYSEFTSATYQAIRECILRHKESNNTFSRIANIPLELRAWLKDTFDLKQEAVTSVITASGIFQHRPHIVGNSWTGLGLEWVIHKVPPIGGINRPDDAVSAFIRDIADRVPTTGTIRVPWSTLEQAREVRQQDYVPVTRDRYAIPTICNPLEWHDMTQENRMNMSNISSGNTEPLHQPVSPWSHNTLIVLREVREGALSDVWPKVQATQQARKRVLLVLQDPPTESKQNSRTQEFFNNINGKVVACFPTGTIPFGHACGWSDAHTSWNGNSHSWILKNGKQIRPPTDVHQDCMQRHANLMNTSPVRFIIFPVNKTTLKKCWTSTTSDFVDSHT